MKYILKNIQNKWEVSYEFYKNGNLKKIEYPADLLEKFNGNYKPFAVSYSELQEIIQKSVGKFQLITVQADLSFAAFWNAYGYKVEKQRAEKLWKAMTDTEKEACFIGIKKYDKFLSTGTRAKKNPDTFLHKRAWEDEY